MLLPSRGNEDLPTALTDSGSVVQAMQRAGLCGPHSATRLLVLSPCTLNDALQSILEVQLLSAFPFCPHIHITFGMKHEPVMDVRPALLSKAHSMTSFTNAIGRAAHLYNGPHGAAGGRSSRCGSRGGAVRGRAARALAHNSAGRGWRHLAPTRHAPGEPQASHVRSVFTPNTPRLRATLQHHVRLSRLATRTPCRHCSRLGG